MNKEMVRFEGCKNLDKICLAILSQKERDYYQNTNVEESLHVVFRILDDLRLFEPPKAVTTKSKEKFEHYKKRGNGAFVSCDLDVALCDYQTASQFAKCKEDLAILYGNISAALFKSGKYLKSLEAINLAVSHGYPRDKFPKFYKRTLDCFKEIGATMPQELSPSQNESAFQIMISETIGILKSKKSSTVPDFALKYVGKKDFKRNKDIEAVSDCVSIIWDETKGSCMIANSDISAGELILSETPVAKSLEIKNSAKFCHECFYPVQVPYPCELCTFVLFCSHECKKTAADRHKRECQLLPRTQDDELDMRPLWAVQLICLHPPQEFIDQTLEIFEQKGKKESVYGKICELQSHSKTNHMMSKICLASSSWFVTRLLADYFQGCTTPIKSRIESLSDVMYHVAFVVAKLLSVAKFNKSGVGSNELRIGPSSFNTIGGALALTYSRFNHACDDNTFQYDVGPRKFIVSKRPIKRGEEITVSYGQSVLASTYAERQSHLKRNYCFECHCAVCQTPPPFVKEINGRVNMEEVHSFICAGCGDKYVWSDLKPKKKHVCKKCHMTLPFGSMLYKYQGMFRRANLLVECEDFYDKQNFCSLLSLIAEFHAMCGSPSYFGVMLEAKLQTVLDSFATEAVLSENK
ncbi:hypothetical protein QYM36_017375 [Artemia franciscana]|uniref:SET and MYND domain-containing protein 4 n=2 Tax=Artemia franciscana TaxID=6661 RepID=A0AA88KX34_ARTSF|nr:hypothetical protein QYM36_017375 [Artemia franciscana]KAK2705311.1 hypothetical protein QYM36_017375 [Artemia franciscana]